MEAFSQPFGAVSSTEAVRPQPRTQPGSLPGLHAPDVSVPLRFILTGMVALFAGAIWLVLRPEMLATYHYNQYIIAVTHLFTLGWISSVVMGAMYQLVPVVLQTRLYSERLARWQFVLHVVGFSGMVWTFWIWNLKQVGHFGSVLALGVGLFVYNLARTLRGVRRPSVVTAAVVSALVWLSVTTLAGLYLACAKCWTFSPFDTIAQMHAHAHLGGIGFFLMILVGVSYKLAPMFTLSEVQSVRRAAWSIAVLNVGLSGLFICLLTMNPWKLAFALVVIAGLGIYGWEMRAIVRARKRRVLDWGLRYFLTAISVLIPLSALAVVLCWPGLPLNIFTGQLENVYGFLALVGVVTFAILGMSYKIVPFLVWYASYSREIGRKEVPALAELYSEHLQAIGYWLFLAGLLLVSVATLLGKVQAVQWSCLLLAASLLAFAINMGRILLHLLRPRVKPFLPQPATQTLS